ncbi:phosphoserine phosphatase SerB [Acidipropionibacterium jensenii]|uniref:phosphoserine phosphatase SerB n=1 Tax=Acidipropionibacterium jensenii TaxID=1749 RepID=UPI0034561F78
MAYRIVLLCDLDDPEPLRHAAQPFWSQAATARGLTGEGWRSLGFKLPAQPLHDVRRLAAEARPAGVDIIAVPPHLADELPGLIVSDVDSTVTRTEGIDLLAEVAGCADQVAEVTARAMNGELDFAQSLTERVGLLKGLPEGALEEAGAAVKVTDGAAELFRQAHQVGCRVGLVSGGFTAMVAPLAAQLGADVLAANELEIVDGALTGRLAGEIVDRAAKERYLRRWADQFGVPMRRTIALGDGANDLDMLGAAGLGIAFCAKPVVVGAADGALSFPRLDALGTLWARP